MSSEQTALAPSETAALVEVPDERLRPTSKWVDLAMSLGVYFGALIPASFIGFGAQMLVIGGAFAFAIMRRRAWFRTVTLQREIQLALASGNFDEAKQLGERLVMQAPRRSFAHAVAVAWWGSIELGCGRPERAIEVMQRALATGRFRGRTGRLFEVWRLEASLALAHAVLGDLDAAEKQLESAETKAGERARRGLFTIRTYVLARRERFEEILARFDSQWRDAEPHLSINGARGARMLEAFAVERTHGHEYRSTSGERFDKALDRAREGRPGVYAYMAVHWPELREFLRRHGLA